MSATAEISCFKCQHLTVRTIFKVGLPAQLNLSNFVLYKRIQKRPILPPKNGLLADGVDGIHRCFICQYTELHAYYDVGR